MPGDRWTSRGSRERILRGLLLSLLAGIIIYFGAIVAGGYEDIAGALSRLGAGTWAAVLGLSLVNYAARFVRWHWYLRHLGHGIPVNRNLACYLAGFAFTTTPGKAGEVVRSVYLKTHGVGYTHSIAVLVTERLLDLIVMIALAMLAALHFPQARWWVLSCAAVLLLCALLLRRDRLWARFAHRPRHFPRGTLTSFVRHLVNVLRASASLFEHRTLYGGLLLGLLGWAAEGLAFYVILRAMEVDASLAIAVGIYASAMVVGALSFIPGGLGSTEAVMGLLLVAAGAEPALAVAATVACRVATLWFAVLLGMMSMAGIEAVRASGLHEPGCAQ